MKKLVALFLLMGICLSVVACGDREFAAEPTTPAVEPTIPTTEPTTPAEDEPKDIYKKALDKWMGAKSFVITGTEFCEKPDGTVETSSVDSVQYIVDENGVVTYLSVSGSSCEYINGNACYRKSHVEDVNREFVYFLDVSKKPSEFDSRRIFYEVYGLSVELGCQQKTAVVTRENGQYSFQSGKVDWEKIEKAMKEHEISGFSHSDMSNGAQYSLDFSVDANGNFTSWCYTVYGITGGEYVKIATTIMFEQFDQLQSIQKPDWVDTARYDWIHWYDKATDDIWVEYLYYSDSIHDPIHKGVGISSVSNENYPKEGLLPYYVVKDEIGGVPVRHVWVSGFALSNLNCGALVIPAGAEAEYNKTADVSQIALFFVDKEENVQKTFRVPGEDNELPLIKAAYYAGQWEYVDGVPTPIS